MLDANKKITRHRINSDSLKKLPGQKAGRLVTVVNQRAIVKRVAILTKPICCPNAGMQSERKRELALDEECR